MPVAARLWKGAPILVMPSWSFCSMAVRTAMIGSGMLQFVEKGLTRRLEFSSRRCWALSAAVDACNNLRKKRESDESRVGCVRLVNCCTLRFSTRISPPKKADRDKGETPIWTYHPVADFDVEKRQLNVLTAPSPEAFLEASKSNLSPLHPGEALSHGA